MREPKGVKMRKLGGKGGRPSSICCEIYTNMWSVHKYHMPQVCHNLFGILGVCLRPGGIIFAFWCRPQAEPSIPFWEGPAISGNALPRALERLYGDTINFDGIPALERLFLNKSALNILKSWPVATTKPHLAMIHIWLWWDQWCRSFDALILLIRSSIFHSFGPAYHCSNTMQNVFAEILYKRRYMLPPGTPPTSCWIFFKRLPWCSRIMYNKVYKVWWTLSWRKTR